MVEHADHVGIAHGRDALAHDHRGQRDPARGGTAYAALADGVAKRRVGLKVERRGGVIHDQDLRRAHQGTRNGQALALTAAEVLAFRLDRGVEPLRLVAHELARLRHIKRRPEFLVGCRLVAPGQVAADGAAHERRALWNSRDHMAQLIERPSAHVGTHYAHAAGARVVQARDKRDKRRLTAARTADNAERFAQRQLQGHVVDGVGGARAKGEARMAQAQRGDWSSATRQFARLGQRNRLVALVGNARHAIEHLVETRRTGARLGKDHDQVGDIHDGGQGLRHVVDERHDLALRELAHVDLDAAHPQDGAHAQVHHQKRDGVENRRELAHRDCDPRLVIGRLGKTPTFVTLAHKRPDHAGARKSLAANKRDAIELCLQLFVVRDAARHDKPKHQADGGRANQKDHAELKVDGKGRDHGAHRQERPADEHTYAQRHGKLHLVDVVGNARDERRRAKAIELSIAQLVDVLVESAANVGAHALRGERRHLLADERKRDADNGHGGEHHAVVDDGTHVVRTDTFIDHLGNHQRRKQVEDHFDQLARRANHHIPAILTTKTPEQLNHKKALPIIISLQSDS